MAYRLRFIARNIIDLPRAIAWSGVVAALVAVLTGFAGPLLILFQAAEKGGLSQAQLSSWVWAVTVGSGLCATVLSLWYRQPVLCAWGSAGGVVMVTALAQYSFAEAVGAYLVVGVALMLLGWSKLFSLAMARVPRSVVSAMLGGVLFRFSIGLFTSFPTSPLMVGAMVATFFVLRRIAFRAPSMGALVVGVAIALLSGETRLTALALAPAAPQFTMPQFSAGALLSIALPLFILANTSQNAPGIAVLRNDGYDTPPDGPIFLTGLITTLTAPFGNHGLNLSAITAAIVTGKEAHPDPTKRYSAGVAYGLWYILFGTFGAASVALFTSLPKALIATVAGLALTGAIISALTNAMAEPSQREGALMAFMLTVSDISILGIGAPFWGLMLGLIVNAVMNWQRDRSAIGRPQPKNADVAAGPSTPTP